MLYFYTYMQQKKLAIKIIGATLLFVTCLATKASAQFAFEGGLNNANLAIKANGTDINTTFRQSANFGVLADFSLGSHIYFEPGLFYKDGGCKIVDIRTGTYDITSTDVPLILEYKSGTKCRTRFLIGAGLNLSYYKNGGYQLDPKGNFPDTAATLKIGSEREDDLKKRGIGFTMNIGYVFTKHFYIRAHYLISATNIYSYGNDQNLLRPSAISVNIGYTFARCKRSDPKYIFDETKTNHWRGMSKGKYSWKPKYGYK